MATSEIHEASPDPSMRRGATRGAPGALLLLVAFVACVGCASFAPLREWPEDPPGGARTGAEVRARFGPPAHVFPWDGGRVLVYRRIVGHSRDHNRLSRADSTQLQIFIYVDREDRVVRTTRTLT